MSDMNSGVDRHPLIAGLIVALFGAAMGFGSSQLFIVGEVKTNTVSIATEKEERTKDEQRESQDITNLTLLFSKNLDQNRELIELVKVQNELLRKQK